MPERCATPVRPPRVPLTCAQIESGEDDPRSLHQLGGVVVCPEMQEEPRLLIQHVPVQSGHHDAVGTQRLEHRVQLFGPRGEVSDDRLTLAPIPVPRGDVVGWATNCADDHRRAGIRGRRALRIDNQRRLGGVDSGVKFGSGDGFSFGSVHARALLAWREAQSLGGFRL
jgi:hypothetical protein